MKAPEPLAALESSGPQDVALENVSFAYDGGAPILRGLTLTAHPGDIIGVTGPVACGKSKLGRIFLCKQRYGGRSRQRWAIWATTPSCGTTRWPPTSCAVRTATP